MKDQLSLRHPAPGDSLKDYPAPAYNKVGQPWSICFVLINLLSSLEITITYFLIAALILMRGV